MTRNMRLTERQRDLLRRMAHDREGRGSWDDGSVLRALERKGMVVQHFNSAPGYIYYTWMISDFGRAVVRDMAGAGALAEQETN